MSQPGESSQSVTNFALNDVIDHYVAAMKERRHPSWQVGGDLLEDREFRQR
jgi:hypothetical protein